MSTSINYEIKNILQDYSEDCGPITHTTRNKYMNKITRLQNGHSEKITVEKNNSSKSINNYSQDSNQSFDSFESDMNKIAKDVRLKQRISNNLSPICYSDRNCNRIYVESLSVVPSQENVSNSGQNWYEGSLRSISNYMKAKDNGLLDISDTDLSDTESTLFKRLRKNYFKRTGTRDNNTQNLSSYVNAGFNFFSFDCNFLPNILLIIFFIFFTIIFCAYLILKTRYSHTALEVSMSRLTCDGKESEQCFSETNIHYLRPYLQRLYGVLCTHAGLNLCKGKSDMRVAFQVAKEYLNKDLENYKMMPIAEADWSRLMTLIMSLPEDQLHIKCYNNEDDVLNSTRLSEEVTFLECLKPKCPLLCRLKLGAKSLVSWVSHFIVATVIVGALSLVVCGLYLYRQRALEVNDRRNMELRDILCKLSEMLKDQLRNSESHPGVESFLSLDKLRMMLQQMYPKLRDPRLWDKVKQYTFTHEPLILVRENLSQGTVLQWRGRPDWQGSAVHSGKEVSFQRAPTQCLKIRNIVVANDNWEEQLRRDLYARLEGESIISHMGFVKRGSKVIAYVMCASKEDAAHTFGKINANYYNRNLLTVKFIRLEKYIQRFPTAIECLK